MLSENATIAIPAAGITSAAISFGDTSGTAGVGRPDGTEPTTTIPLDSSDNAATAAAAATTAISGPGTRGAHRSSAKRNARTAPANSMVGQ